MVKVYVHYENYNPTGETPPSELSEPLELFFSKEEMDRHTAHYKDKHRQEYWECCKYKEFDVAFPEEAFIKQIRAMTKTQRDAFFLRLMRLTVE